MILMEGTVMKQQLVNARYKDTCPAIVDTYFRYDTSRKMRAIDK